MSTLNLYKKNNAISTSKVFFRFTVKEPDPETGLYYFGARYLDPKTSRWMSADPAVGEYVPGPGGGAGGLPNSGVFNYINLHLFHYSNNNPLKYVDPDGRSPTLPRLKAIAAEINRSGYAKLPGQNWSQGIPLFTNKPNDGCFARASIIARLLRNEGYAVNYAVTIRPLMFNQPPDGTRFNYHISASIQINGEWYIVDPYFYGIVDNVNSPGLISFAAWVSRQNPDSSHLLSGYDEEGNVLENIYLRNIYNTYNKNENMSIEEYARKLLEYYNKTNNIFYDGGDF